MQTVFMVAEKPSLAESIAKSLSNGRNSSRRGFNGACSVHEWVGNFRGQQVRFKMTSVCGHVMALDFSDAYNNWDKIDPAELFVGTVEKKEANPKLKMVDYLRHEAKNTNILILWLDCDKEGENICFEVISSVCTVMAQPKLILRAHFSAVTDQEIHGAMKNLREPNRNEALSVDARQELDLRIGCAFTRFQTKFFRGKYGEFTLVSYGPCQTPTLGFCVRRHDIIQSFKPEKFWRIKLTVDEPFSPNGMELSDFMDNVFSRQLVYFMYQNLPSVEQWHDFRSLHLPISCKDLTSDLDLQWTRNRIFDEDAAMVFLNKVKTAKTAEVTKVVVKQETKHRPVGLNTVEMLRVASSGLGIGPHSTMEIAERLYTAGFINYPRTETTAYPSTFDLRGLVQNQINSPAWGDLAREILQVGITPPRAGHDAGDHPPIAPMRLATAQDLGPEAFKLYRFITEHFLASVMPNCIYETTEVTLSVGDGELFTASGCRVLEPGFTRILTWQALEDTHLPDSLLVKGSQVPIVKEPSLVEGQTGPPNHLTEAELITAMEHHGIGTDASIPTHIETIVQRGYVQLTSGRRLQPTPIGILLVHGYHAIDPELVLPHMRKAVEKQLDNIARGNCQYESVLSYTLSIFAAKYRYFVEHINFMDQLFEVSFSSLDVSGRPMSRCGKCHRYMRLVTPSTQRLYCVSCRETYSVPKKGTIRPYKNVKCPLDDFELLCSFQGENDTSFVFCPYCYCHPPFKSMPKLSSCSRCPHPTCPQSMESNAVDACPDCPYGILTLDDSNYPKYRLNCNHCLTHLLISDAVKSVTIGNANCERCTAMHLNLKIDQSKIPSTCGDNSEEIGTNFSGCAFCSETICHLFTIVRKQENSTNFSKRGAHENNSGSNRRSGRRIRTRQ